MFANVLQIHAVSVGLREGIACMCCYNSFKLMDMTKIKDINSNNKIRRAEARIEFLKTKEQNDWTLNEIDKLEKEIETQNRIVKKRNDFLGLK